MIDRIKVMEKVANKHLDAIEKIVKEMIEPLTDFGTPTELIGKKYDDWNRQDHMKARAIFGHEKMNDMEFKSKYDKLKQAEEEVAALEEL